MAGFRISRDIAPDPTPKSKAKKQAGYLNFIRSLPCVITGQYGVEAAHLSMAAPEYGSYGRGKGTKISDRWCLPLSSAAHRRQHEIGESLFWRNAGIDPHVLALVLHGLWSELGDAAEQYAVAIIHQARSHQ